MEKIIIEKVIEQFIAIRETLDEQKDPSPELNKLMLITLLKEFISNLNYIEKNLTPNEKFGEYSNLFEMLCRLALSILYDDEISDEVVLKMSRMIRPLPVKAK